MLSLAAALTDNIKAEMVTFIWHDGLVATRPYNFSQFLPATNKAINDNAIVAGAAQDQQTYLRTAATWNGNDVTAFSALSGFPESYANSINNQGSAVGGSIFGGVIEPTAWINGQTIDLGILSGISGPFGIVGASANTLNEKNEIVGFQYASSGVIPILWLNGQPTELSNLPGHTSAEPTDINESGTIVGYSDGQPVIWRNGVISALPDCSAGSASALNDFEQVVGSCGSNAVLWNSGTMTIIGPDVAVGVDNNGTVVGRTADDPLLSQTYTWTASDGLQMLPGFVWSEPFAISSDNGYILGYGEIAPEPATVALCFGGLVVLSVAYRRKAKQSC